MDTRRWTLVVAAAFLAGCVGGVDEPAPAAGAPSPSAPGSDAAAAADSATEEPAPPAPVEGAFEMEGSTGTFVCYFVAATGGCQGEFSDTAIAPLEPPGEPLRLAGTLAWNSSSPTAGSMRVTILVVNGSAYEWSADVPPVEGPSPLAFDFDLTPLAGRELAVDVSGVSAQQAPPVAYVGASVGQAFRLAATLTYLPPSEGAS